ncbi:MAG: hypothetical protein MJ201_02460 [Mycoplasmoidaceae bacterium]|nr:hypothetical protein [Mycoplasmoidaceae bacterium]
MLDGVGGGTTTELTSSNVFDHLFYGANVLKVSSGFLPPTKLSRNAYSEMFATSELLVAPELPATDVQAWCYQEMFSNCKSLQIPPSILPATLLPGYVYDKMFKDCQSLQYTPIIKAKNIVAQSIKPSYALRQCFTGCQSLKEIYIPYWEVP